MILRSPTQMSVAEVTHRQAKNAGELRPGRQTREVIADRDGYQSRQDPLDDMVFKADKLIDSLPP